MKKIWILLCLFAILNLFLIENVKVIEKDRYVNDFELNYSINEYFEIINNNFDHLEIQNDEYDVSVKCQNKGAFSSFEPTSTNDNFISYNTYFNIKENVFNFQIFNDEFLYVDLKGCLKMNNGEYYLQNIDDSSDYVFIRDLIINSNFDDCSLCQIKFQDMPGYGSGGAGVVVAATFIALEPIIVNACDTTIKLISSTVEQFWNWFKGLFNNEQECKVYSFSFLGVKYKTQAMETESIKNLEENTYYLCIADKNSEVFYFTTVNVDREVAVKVLSLKYMIKSMDKNSDSEFILSTWTKNESDAKSIAKEASYAWGYDGVAHWHDYEYYTIKCYMRHYHPCPIDVKGTPHSFYGAPPC